MARGSLRKAVYTEQKYPVYVDGIAYKETYGTSCQGHRKNMYSA